MEMEAMGAGQSAPASGAGQSAPASGAGQSAPARAEAAEVLGPTTVLGMSAEDWARWRAAVGEESPDDTFYPSSDAGGTP